MKKNKKSCFSKNAVSHRHTLICTARGNTAVLQISGNECKLKTPDHYVAKLFPVFSKTDIKLAPSIGKHVAFFNHHCL